MKILIVDDHPVNLELLDALLTSAGHRVIQAGNGLEALAALEHDGANAVISDILMPQMDGYRLCYEIRHTKKWRDLPLIFYTATYVSPGDEKLALDLGGDAYLRKPASTQDILATLRRVTQQGPRHRAKTHPRLAETTLLKEYSERLVAKLEEKNLELGRSADELARSLAERQRAEDALRLFRTLVDQSNDAFEVVDPETGRFLDMNDRGCHELGYTREEMLRLKVWDIDPLVTEAVWPELMQEARRTGALTLEGIHQRKDGTCFPVEVNVRWVRLDRNYIVSVARDITERKRAAHALALEHSRFQFIFGSMPVGIAWMRRGDPASRIVNPAYARLTGVPLEQAGNLELFRLATHPDDRKKQEHLHQRLVAQEIEHYTLEKRYVHPDGTIVWTELTVRYFRNAATGEVQEISTLVDLSAHREAETALHESRARFEGVVDSAMDAIVSVDESQNIVLFNAAAEKMFLYPRAEIIGRPLERLIPGRFRPAHTRHVHTFGQTGETNRAMGLLGAICGLRATGEEFPLEASISHTTVAGKKLFTAILRDISERKKAEDALQERDERFRQIAENISEVFWITDPAKNQMIYISPAYETIWGRTCASLYQFPRNWIEAIHPDDRERVKTAAVTKQAQGQYDEIYRITRPDGSVRWIHDRAFPLRDAQGKVYRVVGTAEDITKQKKLEEQFRQSQKMEAVGTLAGGIAHDFNNILAAMNGYTELARMKTPKDTPTLEYLDHVLQAGKRATDLVRQILTFSRRQEQIRHPLQLNDLVSETLKLLRATIPSTIEFKISLAANLPAILADATQIHQIIMNLCTNSLQAMRDKPGRLEVRVENFTVDAQLAETHPKLQTGPYVRLSIADTGCGMTKDVMEHIFEPFFTTKALGEGTGLGLSVVHGIMEGHDGAITVYSERGEGTVFHMYFPALTVAADQAAAPAAAIAAGAGQHILYVDDEAPLAELGQKTLEHLGYKVAATTHVEEALNWVNANPQSFDLVITDQTMPGMTGLEFARHVHELRTDLPVLITTGYSATLTAEKMRAVGVCGLLMKPLTVEALSAAVQRALTGTPPA